MFRALLYVIAFTLLMSVLRSVLGIIAKAFSGQSNPFSVRTGGSPGAPPSGASSAPSGGELKKDPVCGTFISTASAFQKYSGGQTYYFCSTECRDKFKG
jgi:YHS domain-containing protein